MKCNHKPTMMNWHEIGITTNLMQRLDESFARFRNGLKHVIWMSNTRDLPFALHRQYRLLQNQTQYIKPEAHRSGSNLRLMHSCHSTSHVCFSDVNLSHITRRRKLRPRNERLPWDPDHLLLRPPYKRRSGEPDFSR